MGPTALVLGAGLGGISAAQALRKALPRDDRVLLVDRTSKQADLEVLMHTGERRKGRREADRAPAPRVRADAPPRRGPTP